MFLGPVQKIRGQRYVFFAALVKPFVQRGMKVPSTRRVYLQMTLETIYVLPFLLSIKAPVEHAYGFHFDNSATRIQMFLWPEDLFQRMNACLLRCFDPNLMSNIVMVLSMRLAYVQMGLESVHVPLLLSRSNLPSLRSMALALIRCCHRPCSAFLDSALFTEIDMHRLDGLAFAGIDVATSFPVDVHVLLPPLDQNLPRTDLWL
jgi:hypothetical protein